MALPWRGVVRQRESLPGEDFAQGIQFAPDGSHVLSWTEERRLFVHTVRHASDGTPEALAASLSLSEGDTIYSCAWWPLMSSSDPSSCCFFAASKDHPVHMWDACTGRIAQSYRAYDDADQIVSPISLGFVSCSESPRLLSGFNRTIRVFDVSRPGRPIRRIKTSESRKSRLGQRGLISCFGDDPSRPRVFAAGSYQGSVGLYDVGEDSDEAMISIAGAHPSGTTTVEFSSDGLLLFTAARRCDEVKCWDVRKLVQPLFTVKRRCCTNQHIDVRYVEGDYVVAGGQDGELQLWYLADRAAAPLVGRVTMHECVAAVSVHPLRSNVVVCSTGERRVGLADEEGFSSDEDDVVAHTSPRGPSCASADHALALVSFEPGA
mmetsp:Transcript_10741/g.34137  ORF Transcript_10741/g.34137 Transcript_10741/m.34137 type:complete len:377 (-) Transcript_10741:56-1186(-)